MKCLRCGYCCCFLDVIIISPSAIDANGCVDLDNKKNYEHKPCNTQCPHLTWEDNGSAVCGIHNYPWFIDTPCYAYTQIESKDSPCRTGDYFVTKNQINIQERLKVLLCQKSFEQMQK